MVRGVKQSGCKIDGCDRPHRALGFCSIHYGRWSRWGDPLYTKIQRGLTGCSVTGCDRPVKGRGLCNMHYQRLINTGETGPVGRLKAPDGSGWLDPRNGYRQLGRNGQKRLEHIWIMETHLGRSLYPDETVHHINGVRDDNRVENLELWSSSHPKGQRVSDKLAWAHEMITRYE